MLKRNRNVTIIRKPPDTDPDNLLLDRPVGAKEAVLRTSSAEEPNSDLKLNLIVNL